MRSRFAVVDLFAGPGGLAEGFAAFRGPSGSHPFRISLSVEKDEAPHATLLLRTFLREFPSGFPDEYYEFLNGGSLEPDWAKLYPREWRQAERTALRIELGSGASERAMLAHVDELREDHRGETVLIGGPPCQAYSLVGRARNRGIDGYLAEEDPKYFLYKEYIRILRRLRPIAFVMENVKGLLSASISGSAVLEQVLQDVRSVRHRGGYELVALAPRTWRPGGLFREPPRPEDFVIRSENFGVPQARHRVIIVGIRRDAMEAFGDSPLHVALTPAGDLRVNVEDVLGGMPKLRSGISHSPDTPESWAEALGCAARLIRRSPGKMNRELETRMKARLDEVARVVELEGRSWPRVGYLPMGLGERCPEALRRWLLDPKLRALPNNETRRHMAADLARYLFAATYAETMGESPKAEVFPAALAPDHQNWRSGKFQDRFRVQLRDRPSTTITSHIAKDGHYFIHPDPEQCRSLTVREAARLQTFPDNYFFKGTRTEQYSQVGNAVPPYLALQIGAALYSILRHSRRECPDEARARASRRGQLVSNQ